jgi:hypothetical protein
MVDEHFSIVDTETGETVLDTAWPHINVSGFDEAIVVGEWQAAFDDGEITEQDFIDVWGTSPAEGYLVSYTPEGDK